MKLIAKFFLKEVQCIILVPVHDSKIGVFWHSITKGVRDCPYQGTFSQKVSEIGPTQGHSHVKV
jgi:hypothetical protein